MRTNKTCYWCGKEATTREHVPPRCFFPKICQKEINHGVAWDNLITVPACEEHNKKKSSLDEYLLTRIVPFADRTNPYVKELMNGKILRAITRNTGLLKPTYFDGNKIHFNADDFKLGYSFESIGRALYFHEFGQCFDGRCYIFFDGYSEQSDLYMRNQEAFKVIKQEMDSWNTSPQGSYPQIFKYRFSPIDEKGCMCLLLTFYESIDTAIVFADKMHMQERMDISFYQEAIKLLDPLPFLIGPQGYKELTEEND